MSHTSFLAALLLLAAPFATGCASAVEGGDGQGGSGGSEGEGGSGGEGGSDGDEGTGGAGSGGVSNEGWCTGTRPDGCLYDVVECREHPDGTTSWECGPTPLVLAFDRQPVRFEVGATAAFDLTGLGQSVASDWPSATTPWLALDRDGDGTIGDGTELFGSAVQLANGSRARNGFEALAELDGNGDGRIDARDQRFGELALWADADADRLTDRGELASVTEGTRRIVSIELGYRIERACDARGNCAVERASFVWADASGELHVGEVVDVHLPLREE